jgi:hypothetical protein
LVYTTHETDITRYPNTTAHLERFRTELKARYGFENGNKEWYEIATPRHKELLDNCKEKLMCPYIASENKFAYDDCSDEHKYYGMTDTTTVVQREGCTTNLKFILAVLNSTTENFYYKTFSKAKDYRYEYFAKTIKKMCIPDISKLDEHKKLVTLELSEHATDLLTLTKLQNKLRRCFSETVRNNLVNTSFNFKDYFNNTVNYSFQKTVLLNRDIEVESSEIELVQEANTIILKAYFDDKWHAVLKLEFSDQNVRDFLYFSIDQFLRTEELSSSWRKGKILNDVILGIKVPKFESNHVENFARILTFMAEIRSKTTLTQIGEITQKIRLIDKKINEKVYSIYDINEKEKSIIEEAIDFGRPYLRY